MDDTVQTYPEETDLTDLRYGLAIERLALIPSEEEVAAAFRPFFADAAKWLLLMDSVRNSGSGRGLYEDILPGAYERSWTSPECASRLLGKELGPLAAALFYELRGCIPFAVRGRKERVLIRMELLLEIYTAFASAFREGENLPRRRDICSIMGLYLGDYAQDEEYGYLADLYDTSISSAELILGGIDMEDPSYIDRFGEYVSEKDRETAAVLCSLSPESVRETVSKAAENWRARMLESGFDLSRCKTVRLSAPLGYGRAIPALAEILAEDGLQALLPAGEQTLFRPWQLKNSQAGGLWGTIANLRYLGDHRDDPARFLDPLLLNRKLEGIREAQSEARAMISACAPIPLVIAPERERERRAALFSVSVKSAAAPAVSAKQRRLEAQWNEAVSSGGFEFPV